MREDNPTMFDAAKNVGESPRSSAAHGSDAPVEHPELCEIVGADATQRTITLKLTGWKSGQRIKMSDKVFLHYRTYGEAHQNARTEPRANYQRDTH